MSAAHTCCKRIFTGLTFRGHPCRKPAKIERDGKHYCAIHDPEYVKARAENRHAKYIEVERKKAEQRETTRRALREQKLKAECFDSLLKALRDLAEGMRAAGITGPYLDAADAAIAKATGETK